LLKAVIFDMDGVIIDSEPMHARAAILALEKFNVTITLDYINDFIGSTTYYMCQKMIDDFNIDATWEELLAANVEMKQSLLSEEGHTVVPYIIDLMKSLHTNGMKLMIASSSPSDSIEEVMESLHIKHYFTGYISGMQVVNPKPAPDIFLAAAKQLQLAPDDCIVIEDSTNGVNAAAAAGMSCIGFVNPNSGKQDLQKATFLVEGFDEVDYDFVNQVFQYAHFEPTTIISTDRLIIRELSVDDIDALYQIYQNPDTRIFLDDFKDSLTVEKEKHKAYIENIYHFYGFGLWGVFLKENQQLIGRCGIELRMIKGAKEYEIGYLLDKSFQGFGYATESVEAVFDYAFTKLNVPRIVALIDKENLTSIRLAENVGMLLNGECVRDHQCYFLYTITRV